MLHGNRARTRAWIVLVVGLAACNRPAPVFSHDALGAAVPWTHERFDTASDKFTFAIFTDLNGGERPGVFDVAAADLALLRPDLVMSVGDLISGPVAEDSALNAEWDAFDARTRVIPGPVFRVGGNHDLTGQVLRDVWSARYGPTYYYFVYKNVLFLILDTEDLTPARMQEMFEARTEAVNRARTGNRDTTGLAYYTMPERITGNIGPDQSQYMRRVIADHPDVRWTFVFMHKPVWLNDDDPDFQAIEAALADRPYTVFNGHFHSMRYTERHGRDYIILGTTGGGQNPADSMSFDHVTMVTMTDDGPSIAHLRLDGILGKDGHIPAHGDTMCFQASAC